MARDAIARLYDVDENLVVFERLRIKQGKYDHGTITFQARKGKNIDLDKLHESVWATRLSGGTRSGLIRLDVTATGKIVANEKETVLEVSGSDQYFVLIENPDFRTEDGEKTAFERVRAAIGRGEPVVRVTGRLDGWGGRWPEVLSTLPPKPRRIIVTSFSLESSL